MGSEAEIEQSSTVPKLPLFSIIPQIQSPQHPGMQTPPLHTTASVPFRWEEEPGKPIPCTAIIKTTSNTDMIRCLELPPRLVYEAITTKMPSPTTVLEGPYMGKPVLQSSSFRVIKDCHGSFDAEKGQLGAMVLSKKGHKPKGIFGSSWGRRALILKGKRDVREDSFVFSSSLNTEDGGSGYISECGTSTGVKMTRIRRNGSFLGLSHARSHILATICEGLKQAIPWGSKRKLNKNNLSA